MLHRGVMRLPTLVAGVVAGLAGLVGAAAGYQQLSASPQRSETVEVAQAAPAADVSAPSPVTKVRLRDCPRGFQLKGKACERLVERTVVIDVAPPAAAPARAVAPASVPSGQGRRASGRGGEDEPATHVGGDDHGGRGGDDQADDDEPGDHHGDEADEDHSGPSGDEADEVQDEDHHGDDGEDDHGDEPDEPEDD